MLKRKNPLILSGLALAVAIGLHTLNGSNTVVHAQDRAQNPNLKTPSTQTIADQFVVRAAINKTTQSFVEVFSRGDVDQVAAHQSDGAELISDEAPPLRGRDAIIEALTRHFAENPKKTIVREVESLRFKSKFSVTEEGHLKVSVGSEAPKNMRYSLDLIHEDGKSLIAGVHEWPSKNAELMNLEWLIGS
ncbi:YybH family protein [Planctomicrobium sp. SH527]|uniref:YybH family protein n=1 Tax=Planctomicrobium sp. SH527 TaxID=3448123 RepID=UPI003F5C5B63